MKIACVVGARPNFIKMAPLIKRLLREPQYFQPVLVHTGQHYDPQLSDVFFRDLQIPVDGHYLGVASGTQAQQTAEIIVKFDSLCASEVFDRVLVVGDVTSTMACAITAKKRCIPVDHVEAGLRSFDHSMPEEINRIITDSVADLFFATEPAAVANLAREGHSKDRILFVGNVMIDSLTENLPRAVMLEKWRDFNVDKGSYAVVTLHRPSNVDSPSRFRQLLQCLRTTSQRMPIIFPVHPRTRKNLDLSFQSERLMFCEPLGYLEFLGLMSGARVLITDSGGIQEETTALQIPCLTLRHNTERPITVEVGSNTLIGNTISDVEDSLASVVDGTYKRGKIPDLWDGKASERIVNSLRELA